MQLASVITIADLSGAGVLVLALIKASSQILSRFRQPQIYYDIVELNKSLGKPISIDTYRLKEQVRLYENGQIILKAIMPKVIQRLLVILIICIILAISVIFDINDSMASEGQFDVLRNIIGQDFEIVDIGSLTLSGILLWFSKNISEGALDPEEKVFIGKYKEVESSIYNEYWKTFMEAYSQEVENKPNKVSHADRPASEEEISGT